MTEPGLTTRTGDLFAQTDLDAIAHGINCRGVMGAGIARRFAQQYPLMKQRYSALCRKGVIRPGAVFEWEPSATEGENTDFALVFNCASQDNPGPHARYDWIHSSVASALDKAAQCGLRTLGVPLIGAGIGGLTPQQTVSALEQAQRTHRQRHAADEACALVLVVYDK